MTAPDFLIRIPLLRHAVLPRLSPCGSQMTMQGTVPVQCILYDLWQAMRNLDGTLASAVVEPTFTFMRVQTDKARLTMSEFKPYFEYREKDVRKGYVDFLDQAHPLARLQLFVPEASIERRYSFREND